MADGRKEFDRPRQRGGHGRGGPQSNGEGGGEPRVAQARVQRAPQEHELHPAGHTRGSRESRGAPLRIDPQQRRQLHGGEVAKHRGGDDAHEGIAERRASNTSVASTPTAPDIVGSSAAETAIPNKLTGSV